MAFLKLPAIFYEDILARIYAKEQSVFVNCMKEILNRAQRKVILSSELPEPEESSRKYNPTDKNNVLSVGSIKDRAGSICVGLRVLRRLRRLCLFLWKVKPPISYCGKPLRNLAGRNDDDSSWWSYIPRTKYLHENLRVDLSNNSRGIAYRWPRRLIP